MCFLAILDIDEPMYVFMHVNVSGIASMPDGLGLTWYMPLKCPSRGWPVAKVG